MNHIGYTAIKNTKIIIYEITNNFIHVKAIQLTIIPDEVQPNIYISISFSGTYQIQFLTCRNRTNS